MERTRKIGGPYAKRPPSELFVQTLTDSSGLVQECEFCGRTFFEDDDSTGDWEAGELEKMRERAKADPNGVIAMDYVARGTIDGKTGVFGCPCNWGTKYEQFIWGYRHFIMSYISSKVKEIVERALEDEGSSDQAEAALKQSDEAQETVRCPKCLKFVSKIAMNEGGMCIRCWQQAEAQIKDEEDQKEREREREEAMKAAAIQERDDGDNLPF